MLHGDVSQEIRATVKVDSLMDATLFVVRTAPRAGDPDGASELVAVDLVGAVVGDRVIVAQGRAARNAWGRGDDVAIEAAIVGLVDVAAPDGRTRSGKVGVRKRKPAPGRVERQSAGRPKRSPALVRDGGGEPGLFDGLSDEEIAPQPVETPGPGTEDGVSEFSGIGDIEDIWDSAEDNC